VTVTLRPYIQDFLAAAGTHFDLVLWSSQQQAFTESVLGALPDVRKHFSAVLDQRHSQASCDGTLMVKCLKSLNRDLA